MSAIDLLDVRKVYRDRDGQDLVALERTRLSLAAGEFLCLLGPSGCGKSTLLNLVAGFEAPSSGEIRVAGRRVERPGADRGVVFQQPTLMPWLTVIDNVAFHLTLKGVGRAERRERAQAYLDLVGLRGFERHYPAELSGGMSQRVGIARALLMNPAVILMDEPFAALDAQTKSEMQEELVAIWERVGATVIFVTHSVDEALVLGTRVAVMSRRPGRIREVLPFDAPRPRDVTSPAFNDVKRHVLGLIRAESARPPRAA
ncbi:ABC transporter ATP-binding protein [Methylobacterium sp. WSM2598]|uniref:ABC transporter ATP-binding protein n=1 Tax=Methylobacterium sp. WSM2598 TaxID=398261 RepID=UPI00037586F9|nr:ABC transporter ATP-binding protein [Methylobacterium sp. WSM2598]